MSGVPAILMGVSCIVTITAFAVTNARHLGAALYNPIVWITPGVVGAVAISFAQRRWRARLAPAGARGPGAEGDPAGARAGAAGGVGVSSGEDVGRA